MIGGILVLALCGGVACDEPARATSTGQSVEGLWKYTRLETSDGRELPLTGIFLFKDGTFVQQAVFDGEPFEEQGAMAHAGPYTAAAGSVHLVAAPTISTDPGGEPPLSFRASTEHDVSVTHEGDALTLVFGSGTIQEFEKVGPGEGVVHALQGGALALVDGYFILVQGDEEEVVTGYGTYEQRGEDLDLSIIRWAEAKPSAAGNMRDVKMRATFDGEVLTLGDGRAFRVVR